MEVFALTLLVAARMPEAALAFFEDVFLGAGLLDITYIVPETSTRPE
jgi:hypothetical protein